MFFKPLNTRSTPRLYFANLLFASTVTVGEMEMKTYPFCDPDPVPATAAKRYPHFRHDGTSIEGSPAKWKTVTLENDSIRVVTLPEVGGKIWGADSFGTVGATVCDNFGIPMPEKCIGESRLDFLH